MSRVDEAVEVQTAADAQKTYVVVLRARSSARFLPENGFETFFGDVPGCAGPVRFRLRSRWVDEGHEAPIPRELWIRGAILQLVGISAADFAELYERLPRDVGSSRKIVRGHFVGDGADPAPAGEEYPRLEWNSRMQTVKREGERFLLSFQEKFTVHCAPTY